jgi:tetratricopeptide (TPR) repeat protein
VDVSRIDELRRRVRQDPASISFAALAEEYRRAGQFQEAIDICREGLRHHPGYLSARVTLGRALLEVGDFQEACGELEHVLTVAPENLVATRTLEEIRRRHNATSTPGSAPASAPVKAATLDIPRIAVSQGPPVPVTETPEAAATETPDAGAQIADAKERDATPLQAADPQCPAQTIDVETTREMQAGDMLIDVAHDADGHVHATAEEPALAGLEAFLEAILRSRREFQHNHEQRR